MREVGDAFVADRPQFRLDTRTGLEHERIAQHAHLRIVQRGLDTIGARQVRWQRGGVGHHHLAQRQHRRPTGQRVVRHIEHPTGPQPARDKFEDAFAVRRRHPTPDAVKSDEVELRQVVARTEHRERLIGRF